MKKLLKKTGNYREIKREFLKIESKQIKTVQNISYG